MKKHYKVEISKKELADKLGIPIKTLNKRIERGELKWDFRSVAFYYVLNELEKLRAKDE